MEMLYEGKAKKVYSTDTKNVLRIEYKNSATAFNGVKKDIIEGKGILNNLFSSFFFTMLAEKNIQSHFIKKISDTEQLVTAVTIIPLEVIVRNVAAGTLAKRIGKEEGFIMKKPIIELCYKNDELGDPILNDDHIEILELATPIELKVIKIKALQINDVLKEYFGNHHIDLIDFKLEFGKTADGNILLADEISPDTCRLWDSTTKQKFDKDVFRRDIAPLRETYQALADKLGIS
jgi:phosphoribosylaminoimidazole-succinocarboxamide synthase